MLFFFLQIFFLMEIQFDFLKNFIIVEILVQNNNGEKFFEEFLDVIVGLFINFIFFLFIVFIFEFCVKF